MNTVIVDENVQFELFEELVRMVRRSIKAACDVYGDDVYFDVNEFVAVKEQQLKVYFDYCISFDELPTFMGFSEFVDFVS